MRLTLRTLLAYLDGLLDPKDAEELGKKIEESEYATTLVHRIRDAMRRLRLGAPSLTERGPGLDANTVAEYLDNTLDSERVAEFEKVCLDSDVHLAEVAACHQILTLVLGEPAEVDPASRLQMYDLKDRSGHAPPLPPTAEQPALPSQPTGPLLDLGDLGGDRKARPKPTVPEYLRESHRKPIWVSVVAAVVLVICITGIGLKSLGQFEPETPLGKLLVEFGLISAPAAPEVAAVTEGEKATPRPPQTASPDAASGVIEQKTKPKSEIPSLPADATKRETPLGLPPADKPETAKALPPSLPVVPVTPGGQAVSPPTDTAKQPPVTPSADATKQVETPKAPVVSPPDQPRNEEPGKAPETAKAPIDMSKPPADTVKPPPSETPKPPADTTKPPLSETPKAPASDESKSTPKAPAIPGVDEMGEKHDAPPGTSPAAPQREALGRLMLSDQVLLSRAGDAEWARVTANQVLFPSHVLALPTYRAKVALTAGVTLDILGGTRLELLGTAASQPPGVRVSYGRAVMRPLAKGDTKLRVAFGDRTGTVTFVDGDSVAAVDVRHLHAPGKNPETDPPRVTATLYAVAGPIVWEETVEGKPSQVQLAAPQKVAFDGVAVPAPVALKEMPRWITAEPIKELDRRASVMLSQYLASEKAEKPARLSLLEAATTRPQREVRWLALRSLGYVGQFSEMVAALDDPAHKLDWQDYYVEELRSAVARDGETAAGVRAALERRYSQQAADLYRMLLGYSQKDLEGGEDAKLVQGLDDDSLAIRRLSFWNLRELTGLGLYYQPEQTAARRRMAVQQWRQRLDAKEIRAKDAEERTLPVERAPRRSVESNAPSAEEPKPTLP
ncbi:MAG: hypothetical protein ABFC63_11965 [Thermoguttaceae bacterium]